MKLFGTDGIRGKYGEFPLDERGLAAVGRGALAYLGKARARIVIGHDTREHGLDVTKSLIGVWGDAAEVIYLGVVTTPALAFATHYYKGDLGVMVTASHNPAPDNGVKFFLSHGCKFDVEREQRLERCMVEALERSRPGAPGCLPEVSQDAIHAYQRGYEVSLEKVPVVVDYAYGSTVVVNQSVYHNWFNVLEERGDRPNGVNINDGVGSEHAESLRSVVVNQSAVMGIAHDGDGDRVVVLDEQGNKVAGEQVLALLALALRDAGQLRGNRVVTTLQSNSGLDLYLQEHDIDVVRCGVGDRQVYYTMRNNGAILGGESSGHYILPGLPTGDGLLAVKYLAEYLSRIGRPLSEMASVISLLPQAEGALEVPDKPALDTLVHLSKDLAELKQLLKGSGRVVVRYSGTEPKLRFLVEAITEAQAEEYLTHLIHAARRDFLDRV